MFSDRFQSGFEIGRERSVEAQSVSRPRVGELERRGVKGLSPKGVKSRRHIIGYAGLPRSRAAIGGVAQDRVPYMCHVHSNLVSPPRLKLYLNQRGECEAFPDAETTD